MTDAADRTAIEAGAGRPFRFSLQMGEGRGRLLHWLGGRWAAGIGIFGVCTAGAAGIVLGEIWDDPPVPPETLLFASSAIGAVAAALHLRPRTVLFERRDGTWCWRERWNLARLGWRAITDEKPLRLEREEYPGAEAFTLYADSFRLFSYLGDPAIGRTVTAAFRTAGVPVRNRLRREG